MLELERALARKLARLRVRISVLDDNTLVLHGVPADSRFFNKPHTNLLLKRPQPGMPFLAFIDEDVEYVGSDDSLSRVFCAGVKQKGWRNLRTDSRLQTDLSNATLSALATLGFDGREPALASDSPDGRGCETGGLLKNLGTSLSRLAKDSKVEPTIGRSDEIDEVASCILRSEQTRLPVVVGESGVGKTNLLNAVARKLAEHRPALNLVSVDLGCMLAGTLFAAERENLLSAVLKEATSPDTVLLLEHLELAMSLTHGALLLTQSLDHRTTIIGSTLPGFVPAFSYPPLARRTSFVALEELSPRQTLQVLQAVRPRIARHHAVEIDESCLRSCLPAAQSLPGCLPAKAIVLLDAAAARTALSGGSMIGPDEIYFAATWLAKGPDPVPADQE